MSSSGTFEPLGPSSSPPAPTTFLPDGHIAVTDLACDELMALYLLTSSRPLPAAEAGPDAPAIIEPMEALTASAARNLRDVFMDRIVRHPTPTVVSSAYSRARIVTPYATSRREKNHRPAANRVAASAVRNTPAPRTLRLAMLSPP